MANKRQEWFDEVYNETRWQLRNICVMLLCGYPELRSDVDDLIQDTYMQMYKKYDKLLSHENIGGWLVEALKRNARSLVREKAREKKRVIRSIDDPEQIETARDDAVNPTEDTVLAKEMRAIWNALWLVYSSSIWSGLLLSDITIILFFIIILIISLNYVNI